MAWMRIMGVDSVAYHEQTVAGRADDPVAAAAEYYTSRDETPMDRNASAPHSWAWSARSTWPTTRAIFGPRRSRPPPRCGRLVRCLRPAMFLIADKADICFAST